jgi:NADH:ubiquinone oxidoreductase subunit 5 (subunit L)/multisubunit Na+/H+ antiporter MnhA subunit
MHFTFHASRFDHIFSNLNWPNGEIHTHSTSLLFISLCFILASLAKSAQLPMSGWLPGAFEGPTPSSAIFYGAISIHMGAYLLLRMYPLFEAVPISKTIIFVIGFSTALYATFVGRTRTDAKTILAYSTMAHVGVIYCEIALGFHFIAVFHICAHASLRTFQFLRSSSLIHDFLDNSLIYENTIIRKDGFYEKVLPLKWQQYLYHVSLNRLFLDHYLNKFFISPFIFVSEFVFKTEDSYAKFFNKDQSAELAEYFDDTEV